MNSGFPDWVISPGGVREGPGVVGLFLSIALLLEILNFCFN